MAPRAAWRLQALGFSEVFVYRAGKSDWSAAGLATDGAVTELRAGHVMHAVATCSPSDLIAELSEERVVVNEGGVILGRVRAAQLTGEPGVRSSEAANLTLPVGYRRGRGGC
jgi:3-mercaptopyruvate sulfurtransferase SseA